MWVAGLRRLGEQAKGVVLAPLAASRDPLAELRYNLSVRNRDIPSVWAPFTLDPRGAQVGGADERRGRVLQPELVKPRASPFIHSWRCSLARLLGEHSHGGYSAITGEHSRPPCVPNKLERVGTPAGSASGTARSGRFDLSPSLAPSALDVEVTLTPPGIFHLWFFIQNNTMQGGVRMTSPSAPRRRQPGRAGAAPQDNARGAPRGVHRVGWGAAGVVKEATSEYTKCTQLNVVYVAS
jgi:hypothetical protein